MPFNTLVGNQYLYQQEVRRNQKRLRHNVNNMRTVLDSKLKLPPPILSAGKAQAQLERNSQIEHDNLLLVEKMRKILATRQLDNIQTLLPKSLNREKRQNKLTKEALENEFMFKRFLHKQGAYDIKKWDKDYENSLKYARIRSAQRENEVSPPKHDRPPSSASSRPSRPPSQTRPASSRPRRRTQTESHASTTRPASSMSARNYHRPPSAHDQRNFNAYRHTQSPGPAPPLGFSPRNNTSGSVPRPASASPYLDSTTYSPYEGFCSSDTPKSQFRNSASISPRAEPPRSHSRPQSKSPRINNSRPASYESSQLGSHLAVLFSLFVLHTAQSR